MPVHPSSATPSSSSSTLADSSISPVPFCVHFSCFLVVYKRTKRERERENGKEGHFPFLLSFCLSIFSFSQTGGLFTTN
jgi:hypothetical protein